MQSPRSLERSASDRPRAPAAEAEIRAQIELLLPLIRQRLQRAGLERAGDVDDALQEFALEALKSAARYDPSRDPRTWLVGIANKIVLRHGERFAKERRRRAPEPTDDAETLDGQLQQAGSVSASTSESAEEVLARRQEVEEALSGLSESHREVLRLFYFEHDQDNDAVALALGISPVNARVRRCRAIEAAAKRSSR
jgi:RNA polymerase sigma factor (sigma-70 family)